MIGIFSMLVASSGFCQTDTSAPQVTAFNVSPNTIDTSADSQDVTVTLTVTDDLSGVSSGGIEFVDPTGTRTVFTDFDSLKRIGGSDLNGAYQFTVNVPRYSRNGEWIVRFLSVNDANGNSQNLTAAQLPPGGSKTFTVSGQSDVTGPQITAFNISPPSIVTGAVSQNLTVTLMATDDLSGVNSGGIEFVDPSGSRTVSSDFDRMNRVGGSDLNGTYQFAVNIPRYSGIGEWTIRLLTVVDASGNSRAWTAAQLPPGSIKTFTVSGQGDLIAPLVTAFNVSPIAINTSAVSQNVTITLTATDDFTGVNTGNLEIEDPTGNQTSFGFFNENDRTAGSNLNGIYQFTVNIPRYSRIGEWRVKSLKVDDDNGNSRNLTAAQLPVGSVKTFTVFGQSDVTAPQLTQFNVSPTAINTGADRQNVTVTLTATDDFSGVNWGFVRFEDPTGNQIETGYFGPFEIKDGTSLDGRYEFNTDIRRYSRNGLWRLREIYLYDEIGNKRILKRSDLPGGSVDAFTVSGTTDTMAPELTGLAIQQAPVNVSSRPQSVKVSFTATDELIGVDWIEMTYSHSSGADLKVSRSQRGENVFSSGNALNGSFDYWLEVPMGSRNGLWQLTLVDVYDFTGNKTSFTTAQLVARGFASSFIVTGGSAVSTPPQQPAPTPAPLVLTPLQQQIKALEARLADVRKRIQNPRARAAQIKKINLQLLKLKAQAAQQR